MQGGPILHIISQAVAGCCSRSYPGPDITSKWLVLHQNLQKFQKIQIFPVTSIDFKKRPYLGSAAVRDRFSGSAWFRMHTIGLVQWLYLVFATQEWKKGKDARRSQVGRVPRVGQSATGTVLTILGGTPGMFWNGSREIAARWVVGVYAHRAWWQRVQVGVVLEPAPNVDFAFTFIALSLGTLGQDCQGIPRNL